MTKRGRPRKNPEVNVPDWANRIVQAREERGLSQEGFAALLGKSQQAVGGWETGAASPRLTEFKAIASALNVDPGWLAFGNPDDGDPLLGAFVERNKDDRLFAWIFYQAVQLFAEEGMQADFAFTVSFTRKLLKSAKGSGNDAEAKEIVQREIEAERTKIREGLKAVRDNLL